MRERPAYRHVTGHTFPARAGVRCEDGAVRPILQSSKLESVRYDVRGPILEEAHRLEAEGHKVMKLNIGNPAPFGFEAPEAILADMIHNLPESQGYSDSRGIFSARTAVANYYQNEGLRDVTVDDVFIGNGVSELISMTLQALLDNGDEVLIPAPDYPLWTAAVTLSGGKAVHYLCDEDNGWNPDLEDIESRITERTKGIVLINPNNPTGAVYSEAIVKGFVEIARKHDLVLIADEIYEKILYDGARHVPRGRLRQGHPLPDLQRPVEGLPGGRVPQRLGRRDRARERAGRLPRGPDPAGQHAHVRQRACPARDPDRARRLPEHQRPDPARRPAPGPARPRPQAAERHSRRLAASSRAARSTSSPGSTPRSTRSRTTRRSSSSCCARRTSSSPTARASTGRRPTTSGS